MSPDARQVGLPPLRASRFLTSDTLFYVGIGIFIVSFLLPAVNLNGLGNFDGFACAWLSLFALQAGMSVSALAFFGGLINPIVIAYVLLRILGRAPSVRKGLAATILFFIPITWLSLAFMSYRIEVGHVAWILGIFFMISWSDLSYYSPTPARARKSLK